MRTGRATPSHGSGGSGAAPVADGGHRLPLAEPGAGGEHLLEPIRAERKIHPLFHLWVTLAALPIPIVATSGPGDPVAD